MCRLLETYVSAAAGPSRAPGVMPPKTCSEDMTVRALWGPRAHRLWHLLWVIAGASV